MLLPSQGSDGYIIKCGVIPAEFLGEGMYYRKIDFSMPFTLNCYGVILTQSYVSNEIDNAASLTNIAVSSFDKNSFTVAAGRSEFLKPIYYIAFGK